MKVGQREPNVIPGFGITLGFTTFFLCAIVLIPLAALVLKAGGMDWERFVNVIASPRALASYKLSFGASLVAAEAGFDRTRTQGCDQPGHRRDGRVRRRL